MIYGDIHSEFFNEQAALLPPALCAGLHYLKETDFVHHEAGKFDISVGSVPMVLQVIDQKTMPREALRPEIHRKNIDVQLLCSGGPELAGFYSDNGLGTVAEDLLSTPRDILFYENNPAFPESRILMVPGTYAVYFPWDVHIPAIQAGSEPADIRKIVLKVPMKACEYGWKY